MIMERAMSGLMLHILTTLKKDPRKCTRDAARRFHMSHSTVCEARTLKRGGAGETRHDGLRGRRCVRREMPPPSPTNACGCPDSGRALLEDGASLDGCATCWRLDQNETYKRWATLLLLIEPWAYLLVRCRCRRARCLSQTSRQLGACGLAARATGDVSL
ncbi:hypothetical protein EVAR_29755_1 [Eumeta japonica]|uniref:Uncharacterized protein n=1 Tax=Eumeta variegata TaxID=151549 RepID=A0A4C1WVH8_EUMVA|nr:hypothetical protein EVAR_29755_1 [Eumeta japonica]